MNMNLGVYVISDRQLCGARGIVATMGAAAAGGAGIIQYRDKTADAADQLREIERLCEAIAGRCPLVVNDRLDVALEGILRGLPIAGVHLGQADTSVVAAREELGPDALIGLSANTADQLRVIEALPDGTLNYLGVGVIRETNTKLDHPPALGFDGFASFARRTPLPCVTIGGIGIRDIARIREAGGAGAAVVSAVCTAPDPEAMTRAMRREWDSL